MEFHGAWAWLSLIIYIIGTLAVLGITAELRSDDYYPQRPSPDELRRQAPWESQEQYEERIERGKARLAAYEAAFKVANRQSLRKFWLTFVSWWLAGFVIMNGLTFLGSWLSAVDRSATVAEQAAVFGFQSGKTYPLTIGTTVTGAMGTGSLDGGLFHIEGHISIEPGTTLRVGFDNDKWWLNLPTNNIEWVKDDSAKPSMVVYLKDLSYYKGDPGVDGTETKVIYGSCHYTFDNLVFVCNKPVTSYLTTLDADNRHAGLPPLIENNLSGVKITLPESMENELMTQH